MALTDPIADALTCIRNARRVNKEKVDVRASNIIRNILKVLRQERFIHDFRDIEDNKHGILRVYLKKEGEPIRKIHRIVRISRSSLRVYAGKDEIPRVLNGLGICVLSTPKGVLSGKEARRQSVGGEVLLKIW
ncbi:MAG: 30S ribosomal protein S8 [Candidatus Omnitrophota bacterium]